MGNCTSVATTRMCSTGSTTSSSREAISGFGQSLETRFADSISLLTGALPAQYG